jgi:hypothetical protein
MYHTQENKERHKTFWLGNLKGRDLGVYGRIILVWILDKLGGNVWTAFLWLR